MISSKQPSVEQLKKAVAIAEQIKTLEAQLEAILSGSVAAPATRGRKPKAVKAEKAVSTGKKKRMMSPEGRARIAAAQKARWAKAKKG